MCLQNDPVWVPLLPLSAPPDPEVLRHQRGAQSDAPDGVRPGLQLGEMGEEDDLIFGIIHYLLLILLLFIIILGFSIKGGPYLTMLCTTFCSHKEDLY